MKNREFPDKDAPAWLSIRHAYQKAINDFNIRIAAPGQSVLKLQNQLDPAFKTLTSAIIPHGFPAMADLRTILPKPRKDGRLRLLIPGRMQTGKGLQLLSRALPELVKHVQVYLLGTGKSGEAFFGMSGVDVILEYERDELVSILSMIGPDFAALLSVVPETFSFTLSELQQMHIPMIATRVGSFPLRIEHGKTGWLIDAEAQALLKQVVALCDSKDQIETVRSNLPDITCNTLPDMLAAYNKLCPLKATGHIMISAEAGLKQTQRAAAEYQRYMAGNELQQMIGQRFKLKKELEERTAWALESGKQLKLERKQRKDWVERLDTEIIRLQAMVEERQHQVDQLWQIESDYQYVSEQHALILASSSWKITRPLRASRRVAKNFMLARAWNPARWPWLVSQMVRNLTTLGLEGSLHRLQYTGAEVIP